MKQSFTYGELGVSPEDSVQLISHVVFKVIDGEYCGDAVITNIYESKGQIIVEFEKEAY